METPKQKQLGDIMAWFMNVSTSVVIVFVNKALIDPKKGHAFTFATTLSALHFLVSAASLWLQAFITGVQHPKLPWKDNLYFSLIANLSIASLNISLLVNSVGFYQIAKLLIIPFVAVMEMVWFQRRFTPPVAASMVTVAVGVAIVTVADVSVNTTGLVVAGISVVSSGMQQLLCGVIQRKHKLQSYQLLANTAPIQGAILIVLGPPIDFWITGSKVTDYSWTTAAALVMAASCSVAVLVNISQFMCLGRFSAVTFQVLGHTKTILVLLISWLVLHEHMSGRKLCGMALAVAGMVAYGHYNGKAAVATAKSSDALPLLGKQRVTSDGSSGGAGGSTQAA
ncbi:MAG: triose-phosphate transporter family-domain-containing protein [Monoraphidium minutum]|nr:MAG: triose-phosphate transporter family-domain-containing protein [Monoraphidium minutum]